jgi:WD40 repeat protein
MNIKSPIGIHRLRGLICLAALVFLIASDTKTIAQTTEPSREPVLRIETGMHTAAIKSIGVDRAGRFLVTVSHDKTARLWELTTGNLIRVLRVPIGGGNEGNLHAVAISPDGNTIAVGGWTGVDWDNQVCVYIFDRETGRLTHRLTGLPQVILHLVFSPNGARLAATLGATSGVRVWRTSDWMEDGRDIAYGDGSVDADFDRANRLVTSCLDGSIRLYNQRMQLLTKRKTSGKRPMSVRFSPDGRRVAVSYDDRPNVDVLSSDTLSLLYSADTSDISNGDMLSVAWSADGNILYAGGRHVSGTFNADGTHPKGVASLIRRWSDAGRGPYVDTPAARSSILDIASLPSGGIVYSASDPLWGILDARNKQVGVLVGQTADYREIGGSNFLANKTGSIIHFNYQEFGEYPAAFSLADRKLVLNPQPDDNSARLPTGAPGISITDWEDSDTPQLNNTPLKLEPNEMSRSLAIAPDGDHFLLGTDYAIRLFNRAGQEMWNAPAPDVGWAVNISGDGRLVIAAYGDGTIRWYRMIDGKEMLAFFPHADRKRWVLWTPSGYYDAAPGAEDLIGWHVNNGKDQAADFFPVGQFRSTYYRPDVIARILQTGDEQVALQQANEAAGRKEQESTVAQQLPPVVEIMSPSDSSEVSSTEIAVRFRVRTPSGEPVTTVKALVDGRPMGARQLVREAVTSNVDRMRELRVTVPERDSEIAIIAENRFTSSVPATVRVKWHSATAARPEAFVVKPKLYILAIGVSQYADSKFNLKLADKDAGDFVKAMIAQKDLLYREVVVKLLTNEKATKDDVLDGLDWIRQETTSNDVAMVFFAGHGVNDQNNYYYFCPYNVDPSRLLRTGVAFSDIKKTVSAIAGKALFFVDSCHSGNAIGLAARRGPLDINIVINELSSAENGVVVFSASTGSESSYEREEWNNGAFTKALVEGLGGAASIGTTGRITYNMLNVYISERVKELTKGQQHPTMISPHTVPDFPIAVKK